MGWYVEVFEAIVVFVGSAREDALALGLVIDGKVRARVKS